jgi:hypothetical protein
LFEVNLQICNIEKDILDIIDLENVLEDFASRNTQRHFLKNIEAL